jgi:hypothetical protein
MEAKFQTSFIPKKPIIQEERIHSRLSIFLLISLIIFFVSLGLAGWVFLKNKLLIQQIVDQQKTVQTNKNGLTKDSVTVESIVALDSRIMLANQLLANHVAISPIFSFLGQRTLTNVRFKSFSVTSVGQDSTGVTSVKIEMSGQAKDFNSVASQADEFGKSDYTNIIKEPKISGLSLNPDGSVAFIFSASIVTNFISYSKNISTNNNPNI